MSDFRHRAEPVVKRSRSIQKGHAAEIKSEPMLITALLSLAHLPRAIRLARKPVVPAPAPIQELEPQESAGWRARVEERSELRSWSAKHVGLEEALEMLAGYLVDPQSISRGRWRTTSIGQVCGGREEIYVLFDRIHEDPELSAFREALRRQLHRQRDAARILRDAWPEVEQEARRFAAIRERRRVSDDDGPREPEDRFRPGR